MVNITSFLSKFVFITLVIISFLALLIYAANDSVSEVVNNQNTNETPTGDTIIILPVEPTVNETLSLNSTEGTALIEEPVEETVNETTIPIVNETQEPLVEEPNILTTLLTLVVGKVTAFIGDVINIQAILTSDNDTPLPDKKVDFYAGEFIGSNITDNEGKAEIKWNTSAWLPGIYTVTASYAGDESYKSVLIARDISIEEKTESNTTLQQLSINVANHTLAKVYNQENLNYDKDYAKKYLDSHHNFSDLKFKRVRDNAEDFTLSMGNKVDDLKGIKTDKGKFVINLIYCDEIQKFCKFRINGVPTTKLYAPENLDDKDKKDSFDIDGDFILKVKSAEFNKCDNHRFCNLGFEGYHAVDILIERKK